MPTCQDNPDPRANQKARTRAAIVAAAQQLRGQGQAPTVAEAAQAAGVARATAYRYFPTQQALVVELEQMIPAAARIDELLERLDAQDVEARFLTVLDMFGRIVLSEEEHMRRALWVSHDTWLRNSAGGAHATVSVREGRRMRWIDRLLDALPALPDAERARLRAALALTLGIDSVVVMKDVCGLGDEDALAVLRWTATTLLRTALKPQPEPA